MCTLYREDYLGACVVFIHSHSKHSFCIIFMLVLLVNEDTQKLGYLYFHDQILKGEVNTFLSELLLGARSVRGLGSRVIFLEKDGCLHEAL